MSVLTLDILNKAFEKSKESFGKSNSIILSPKLFEDFKRYESHERWLKSLGPKKEKQQRLKEKLINRISYKKLNLPK